MSPIERGELENSVNAQIVGIVVLSRLLKWIKSSLYGVICHIIATSVAVTTAETETIAKPRPLTPEHSALR
jgi:hypothetical protein